MNKTKITGFQLYKIKVIPCLSQSQFYFNKSPRVLIPDGLSLTAPLQRVCIRYLLIYKVII